MNSSAHPSSDDLAMRAREQLGEAERRLQKELEGVDARAIFASYALSRFVQLHSGKATASMRPAPAAVELAAWLLFPHFERHGSQDPADIQRAIDAIEAYQSAYTFREMLPGDEAYDELDSHLRMFTGIVRGSAYPIQIRRRIEGIFKKLEGAIRARVGIGPLRAMEVSLAILNQSAENIEAMRTRFHALVEQRRSLEQEDKCEGPEEMAQRIEREVTDCLSEMSGAWVPSREEISQKMCSIGQAEWEALRAAIGFSTHTLASMARVVDIQDRPLYFLRPDRVFSLQGTTVLDGIFSHFDDLARNDSGLVNRYVENAAKWMEFTIAEQMGRLFPDDCILQGACFRDPDNEGGETEADVVVHWGPFLLVLEAKNNRVAKSAVRGGGKGLRNVISKNIQDAFYQARRVIRVLEEDGAIVFKERYGRRRVLTVTGSRLKRVMPISVTLQYLFGIATQLAVTQRLGLFKGNAYPWSVCIDDLDVITRFAGGPDIFLYYIERRTAHQGLELRLNGDELDIFGQFLDNRLHPSKYENRKEIEEHSGPRSISISGGEEKFEPHYAADWFGGAGPVEKPGLDLPETIVSFLDELRRRPGDDARFIAFALLSLNQNALMRIDHSVKSFRRGSGPEYQILRSTIHQDNVVVNVLAHQSLGFDKFFTSVTIRTRMEHYRAKARATVSFGIDLRKPDPFEIVQWLEGEWQYEQAIEDILKNDQGQKRLFHLPEGAKKPGRNDPCPCGSGRKFKKCCFNYTEVRSDYNEC